MRPPPVSALPTMLQNPFYIGIVEWDGVRHRAKHGVTFHTQNIEISEVYTLAYLPGERPDCALAHCGAPGYLLG